MLNIKPLLLVTAAAWLIGCGGAPAPLPLISPPELASSSKIQEARRFEPVEGMANLYVSAGYNGHINSNLMVSVRGEGESEFTRIGSLNAGWTQNFAVSPGQWRVRMQFNTRNTGAYLLSEFDLILEDNAVAVVDCSGDIGAVRYIRVDSPALRRFDDACPEGVEIENGIGACHVPYENNVTSWDAIINEGAYIGACEIVEPGQIYERRLARSYTDVVTNSDFEFARAQQIDTEEGWQRFISMVSDPEYLTYAQNRIAEIEAEQEYMAWEGEIQAILKRDSVLPVQAQRDKYMIALTGFLQTQDFEPSLLYFELLERMNIEQSDSITHFWGEALLRTGDPQEALTKFYEYINAAGSSGTYYRDALALINEAEAADSEQQAQAVESSLLEETADTDFSGSLQVTNSTGGYDIWYLYVRHSDSPSWGDDVLGSDILYSGGSFRVELDGHPSSIFDVKAVDEDEDSYTFYSIDVATQGLTIRLSDLD